MKVILISGHAQNGKDTCAGILKTKLMHNGYRVLICHYGDLVKYICTTFFGWNGLKDHQGRSLLQRIGTDVIREKQPDYWVNFIIDILMFFQNEWDYVIIPDTRFPNEVDRISEKFNSVHLRVERKHFKSPLSIEQQNHPSETALDNCEPDVWIHNNGSLEDLRNKIEQVIWEVL